MKSKISILSYACIGSLAFVNLVACSSSGRHADATHPTELSGEVSLAADRSQLSELRKDIPEDVKHENDELAGLLQLMVKSDGSNSMDEPSRVRERFDKIMRDKRSRVDKELQKMRDSFSKAETKSRETFGKEQKIERDRFMSKSHRISDERKEFFDGQEDKRREYYSDQQDKRRDFEAHISDQRKNFEDYAREKAGDFNQEYRAYTKAYDERRKAESLKKDMKEKAQQMKMAPPPGSDSGDSSANGTFNGGYQVPNDAAALGGAPAAAAHDPDIDAFKKIPKKSATHLGSDEQ
jgi:ElaB/YqjD/DUF883 family membrane-anchored ribosome-binding protein